LLVSIVDSFEKLTNARPDYIPPYLSPETQVALRVEMEKVRSAADVEGYIYTFEIRGKSLPSISFQLLIFFATQTRHLHKFS
jgi:hypothetical protein